MPQSIENKRPDSIEAKRDLSVSLEKLADSIFYKRGDADKALVKYYQESFNVRPRV